jgi:hypothetical protein
MPTETIALPRTKATTNAAVLDRHNGLQLIGAGYGRTGTTSLYTALNQLGLPCYHMKEVLGNTANKYHSDFWIHVADAPEGQQHDWNTVFANYAATVDYPGCCAWRELHAAYPDAKVLLSLHPKGAETWYESVMDTIYFTETQWQFKLLAVFVPFLRKMRTMNHKLVWQGMHQGDMGKKAAAIQHYNDHITEVKATVPADQLLVYSVDQGWGPLCTFLGLPVPNTPFPNVNDLKEMKQGIANIAKGAYVVLGVIAFLLATLVYGLVWMR